MTKIMSHAETKIEADALTVGDRVTWTPGSHAAIVSNYRPGSKSAWVTLESGLACFEARLTELARVNG